MRRLGTLVLFTLILATPALAQDRRPPKGQTSWDDWPPELKRRLEEKRRPGDSSYNQDWVGWNIIPQLKIATDNWDKAVAGDAAAFDKAREALLAANKKMADAQNEAPAWGPRIEEDLKIHEWVDGRTLELYRACEDSLLKRFAAAKPAPEVYEGPDREKLRAALRQKWLEAWPKDNVLVVRVEDDAWHRRVENRRLGNGSTEVVDTSTLAWRVYVAYTDRISIGYVVEATRNNLDETIVWGVWAKPSTGFYNFGDYPTANVPASGGTSVWLLLGCCCPLLLVVALGGGLALYLKQKAAAPAAGAAGASPPAPPAPPAGPPASPPASA